MDFVVLDTEGKPELSELAIVSSQGRVIYEGFAKNHSKNSSSIPNLKSLTTLLTEFLTVVQGKKIVCHYAQHDKEILESSFRKAGLMKLPKRLMEIKSKVAHERVTQLRNSPNGNFVLLSKQDRIHFDLIYQLIIDIQNKDLDVELEVALKVLVTYPEWYHWLFTMFGFTKPVAHSD